MWNIHGTPRRGEDHEDSGAEGPPEDKKSKHWRFFTPTWGSLKHSPQRFYREVVLWGTLFHPNILKLVGVQEDTKKRQLVTVSEWMMHGTIMEYVEKHHTNRLELVRGFTLRVTSFTQAPIVARGCPGSKVPP